MNITNDQNEQKTWKSLQIEAKTAANAGLFATAESLFLQALEIAEKKFGPHHGEVGLVLLKLAKLYELERKPALAEPLHVRIQEILTVYQEDQQS